MHKIKRRRLAYKDWKLGATAEFPGLSDDEARYVELRVGLSEGLRQRRLQRAVPQIDPARALRSSQSRVAKMEAGDPSVSLDLLVRSLIALGVTNRDLAGMIG